MELAEERNQPCPSSSAASSRSEKIRFTPAWASSKLPSTAQTFTLSPDWVTICRRYTSLTPSRG